MVNNETKFIKQDLTDHTILNKQIKKSALRSIKSFFALNWRIVILLLLLIASILFIWWSNTQVDENFTNAFQ